MLFENSRVWVNTDSITIKNPLLDKTIELSNLVSVQRKSSKMAGAILSTKWLGTIGAIMSAALFGEVIVELGAKNEVGKTEKCTLKLQKEDYIKFSRAVSTALSKHSEYNPGEPVAGKGPLKS